MRLKIKNETFLGDFQTLCLEQKLKSADGNEAKQQKVTRLMCLILNYLVWLHLAKFYIQRQVLLLFKVVQKSSLALEMNNKWISWFLSMSN